MINRNPKIFKFPRREMQVSEEVNKKRVQNEQQKVIEPSLSIPNQVKEEAKELTISVYEKDLQGTGRLHEDLRQQKQLQCLKNQNDKGSKRENFMRMSEKGVLFEKKLTKIALPDHYQKLKFIGKIENKLLNCLQKKKPLIPMKKLVSIEMLNHILGKKQRRLVCDRPHFVDELDVEAHSMKKQEEKSSEGTNPRRTPPKQDVKQSKDERLKLKLVPLRVPSFEDQEEPSTFFSPEGGDFIFQPADEGDFNFFNQDDTIFDTLEHPNDRPTINFCPNDRPTKPNFFEQRKSTFIERRQQSQGQKSFFANMEQFQFDEDRFNNMRKSNIRPPADFDASRGKVQLPRGETSRSSNHSNFNIFSIEEEPSHFFSPEKQKEKAGRLHRQGQANWKSNEVFSGSSDGYY